jgi:hypothetical protein
MAGNDRLRGWLHAVADFIADHPYWSLLILIVASVVKGIAEAFTKALLG